MNHLRHIVLGITAIAITAVAVAAPSATTPSVASEPTLSWSFPGWRGDRAIARCVLAVPRSWFDASDAGDTERGHVDIEGTIRTGETVIDRFRYRFDPPASWTTASATTDAVSLVFERDPKPGAHDVEVTVRDAAGSRTARFARALMVPAKRGEGQASDNGLVEATVELILPHGDLMTGLLRFEARVTGEGIERVAFSLDGRTILTKRSPPYSLEVDLGRLPRGQPLRATAFDAEGNELASDEHIINGSPHRFDVRLVAPTSGTHHETSVRARVDLDVPENEALDRLELFLGDDRVATLYQPPFTQLLPLPAPSALTLVRALGHLRGGVTAEDVAIVNGPDHLDEIDINLVELHTSVLDRKRRPVLGLNADDFQVFEEGQAQTIQRFEVERDRPIHATILLDVSASMAPRLETARKAATRFFTSTVRPGGPDRVAAITFNDRPSVVAPFGNDVEAFTEGLAGARAARGTSFYDSVLYALFYTSGLPGQRAILLLSDGVDENSRFDLDDTLDYARRAEVTVYAIGLDLPGGKSLDRRVLGKLAEETGGRSYFLSDIRELAAVYDTIREELRSRYLIAYQSNNESTRGGFRRVEVKVKGKGEAKTIRGYYP